MLKLSIYFLSLIFFSVALLACNKEETNKIGIIVPIEHRALTEIVAGFSETFKQHYKNSFQIKVLNAQGDINLQRAMIQQLRDQHYSLIVPVATGTTQMTLAMVHQQPIVSLAAEIEEKDRKKLQICNISAVHDEIPPVKSIQFIHATYPKLTELTLIHSTSDKIFPEVKNSIKAGEQLGIKIKPLMVSSLPELMSTLQNLPVETQGIFILKDNLIASGVSTLIKITKEKNLPLITSDQGTVEGGANFALGVPERKIGEEGAKLAIAILNGKSPCDLPITEMQELSVFVNKKTLTQNQLATVLEAAKKLHYQIVISG